MDNQFPTSKQYIDRLVEGMETPMTLLPAFAAILSTAAVVAGPRRASKEFYRFIKASASKLGSSVSRAHSELQQGRFLEIGRPAYHAHGFEFPVYYADGTHKIIQIMFGPEGISVGDGLTHKKPKKFSYADPVKGLQIIMKKIYAGGKKISKTYSQISSPYNIRAMKRLGHYNL